MKDHLLAVRTPLIVALALGALGFAGLGFAQSTSSDKSGACFSAKRPGTFERPTCTR